MNLPTEKIKDNFNYSLRQMDVLYSEFYNVEKLLEFKAKLCVGKSRIENLFSEIQYGLSISDLDNKLYTLQSEFQMFQSNSLDAIRTVNSYGHKLVNFLDKQVNPRYSSFEARNLKNWEYSNFWTNSLGMCIIALILVMILVIGKCYILDNVSSVNWKEIQPEEIQPDTAIPYIENNVQGSSKQENENFTYLEVQEQSDTIQSVNAMVKVRDQNTFKQRESILNKVSTYGPGKAYVNFVLNESKFAGYDFYSNNNFLFKIPVFINRVTVSAIVDAGINSLNIRDVNNFKVWPDYGHFYEISVEEGDNITLDFASNQIKNN